MSTSTEISLSKTTPNEEEEMTSYRTRRFDRPAPALLRPDRLRTIAPPFGWLPCRLLTDGLLEQLSQPATQLCLLLALAADRQGISYYGDLRIQRILSISADELEQARTELVDLDLLAFDGHTYQLLSLPDRLGACVHAQPCSQPQTMEPSTSPPSTPPPSTPDPPHPKPSASSAKPFPDPTTHPHKPTTHPHKIPEEARKQLRAILGRDVF